MVVQYTPERSYESPSGQTSFSWSQTSQTSESDDHAAQYLYSQWPPEASVHENSYPTFCHAVRDNANSSYQEPHSSVVDTHGGALTATTNQPRHRIPDGFPRIPTPDVVITTPISTRDDASRLMQLHFKATGTTTQPNFCSQRSNPHGLDNEAFEKHSAIYSPVNTRLTENAVSGHKRKWTDETHPTNRMSHSALARQLILPALPQNTLQPEKQQEINEGMIRQPHHDLYNQIGPLEQTSNARERVCHPMTRKIRPDAREGVEIESRPLPGNQELLLTSQRISALQRPNFDNQDAFPRVQIDSEAGLEPTRDERDGLQIDCPKDVKERSKIRHNRWTVDPGFGLIDLFERKGINMPPLIGSYLHYTNKRLKYNPIPERLDEIREKLLQVREPILLCSQQIADYWPHMSNVWERSIRQEDHEIGVGMETWECRQRRRVASKDRGRPDQAGTRVKVSKRRMLEGHEPCAMRIVLMYFTKHAASNENHKTGFMNCKCMPEWMYLRRTDRATREEHTHDLEFLDKFKRSNAMMFLAKSKAEKGYSFSAVANWLHNKYDDLTSQAKFMTKHEVSNVAQKWRQAHRDVEMRTTVKDETPEEVEERRRLDLINSTTEEGLMIALAAVFEAIPAAITIATPVLEALQVKNSHVHVPPTVIKEGKNIQAPFPGLHPRWRHSKPPQVRNGPEQRNTAQQADPDVLDVTSNKGQRPVCVTDPPANIHQPSTRVDDWSRTHPDNTTRIHRPPGSLLTGPATPHPDADASASIHLQ